MTDTHAAALVIDLIKVQHIDYTGVLGMREMVAEMRALGATVVLANVLPHVASMLRRGQICAEEVAICASVTEAVTLAAADVAERGGTSAAQSAANGSRRSHVRTDDPHQPLLAFADVTDHGTLN